MAKNQWGSTEVSEWVITGDTMLVTVMFPIPTSSSTPHVFVSLRTNQSTQPTFGQLRVESMGSAGFVAKTATADGSDITAEQLERAWIYIDWLAHDR